MTKDNTADSELRTKIYGLAFAIETHPDDFVLRINQKGVEDLLNLIAQEANKARIACKQELVDDLDEAIMMPGRKAGWLKAWLKDEEQKLAQLTAEKDITA